MPVNLLNMDFSNEQQNGQFPFGIWPLPVERNNWSSELTDVKKIKDFKRNPLIPGCAWPRVQSVFERFNPFNQPGTGERLMLDVEDFWFVNDSIVAPRRVKMNGQDYTLIGTQYETFGSVYGVIPELFHGKNTLQALAAKTVFYEYGHWPQLISEQLSHDYPLWDWDWHGITHTDKTYHSLVDLTVNGENYLVRMSYTDHEQFCRVYRMPLDKDFRHYFRYEQPLEIDTDITPEYLWNFILGCCDSEMDFDNFCYDGRLTPMEFGDSFKDYFASDSEEEEVEYATLVETSEDKRRQIIQIQGQVMSAAKSARNFNRLANIMINSHDTLLEKLDDPTSIISRIWGLLVSVTDIATTIWNMLDDFCRDPIAVSKRIISGFDFTLSSDITGAGFVVDSALYVAILALAHYIIDDHPIISTGLIILSTYYYHLGIFPKTDLEAVVVITLSILGGAFGLNKLLTGPIELQSKADPCSLVVSFASVIAMLTAGAFKAKSFTDIINHASKIAKPITNLTRSVPSLVTFFSYGAELIKHLLVWIFGENSVWLALNKNFISDDDMKDYIEYAMMTSPEELTVQVAVSKEARERWERMNRLHSQFITLFASDKTRPDMNHVGFKIYENASKKFSELKEEYRKIKNAFEAFRPEPFIIWTYGEPGVGKTFLRDSLASYLYVVHKDIDPTVPDIMETGLTFVRNPADPYVSGYNWQFCFSNDDVGNNRNPNNPEFAEIMGMASTNQMRLPMAELKDKGMLFNSKLILLLANTRDVNSNNLVLFEEAFNRRRHIVVEMIRPDKETSGFKTSKKDHSKVRYVIRDPQNSETILKSFPEEGYLDHLEGLRQLCTFLRPIYIAHVKEQQEYVREKEKQFHLAKMGKTIFDEEGDVYTDALANDDDLIKFEEVGQELTLRFTTLAAKDSEVSEAFDGYVKSSNYCTKERIWLALAKYNTITREMFDLFISYLDEKKSSAVKITKSQFSTVKEWLTPVWSAARDYVRPIGAVLGLCSAIGAGFGAYQLLFKKKEKPNVESQAYDRGPIFKQRPIVQGMEVLAGRKVSDCFEIVYEQHQVPFMFKSMVKVLKEGVDSSDCDALEYYHLYDKMIKHVLKHVPGVSTITCQVPILKPKVDLQAYERGPVFVNKPIVQSATEEIPMLAKNLYFFSYSQNGYIRRVHGVNLKYNCFLIPWHFLTSYEDGLVVEVKRQGTQGGEFVRNCVFHSSNIRKIGDTDWAVVRIESFNQGKSIVQHFATKEDLRSTRVFKGALISYDPFKREHLYISQLGNVHSYDAPLEVVNDDGETVLHRNAYRYKLETVNGDCGAMLVAIDNKMRRKVFGLHFGYSKHLKEAYASIVPQEELLKIIDELVPVVERFEVREPKVVVTDVQCQEAFMANGIVALETFGTVADAPMQPKVHKDLFRSPLYGKVYEPEKDLSVLSNRDKRLNPELQGGLEIATRNVLGFAPTTIEWPKKHLSMAQSILQAEFQRFDAPTSIDIKSIDWAVNGELVNGARVEHCEALNLLTSAGYGLSGKKKGHFEQKDDLTWKISNLTLQQMIDEQWKSWEDGNAIPTIWTHALKSETLKLEKVRLGKTRTFCVAQTAFLINFRRLFGAWISAMRNSKIKSFSCLGMDVYSSDWTFLYRALREKGAHGIDMDFKNYDRVAVTWQLVKAVVEEINAYYNDGPVYARMRMQAAHDLVFSFGLCDGVLTRKYQGNPSGNPMTTELNNCINFLMFVMVVSILRERHRIPETLPQLIRKIAAKFFGDDCIISVDPSLELWLNPAEIQQVYESIGITVTPASKSEDTLGFKPLDQLTFLKCSFVPSDIPQYPWRAGLDKTSIRSLTQFYRSNGHDATMEEAVQENLKLSCEYAYYWGREFFNDHKQKINNCLQKMEQRSFGYIDVEYDDLDYIYKLKLGL